jgi:hypothetical protein
MSLREPRAAGWTVDLTGDPEAVHATLLDLARRVAAAPDGRALLEVPWGRPGPARVHAIPPEGWPGPELRAVRVRPASGVPDLPPLDPEGREEEVVLVGSAQDPTSSPSLSDRTRRSPSAVGPPSPDPDPEAPLPVDPSLRATWQVHWASGPGGELWVAGRLRLGRAAASEPQHPWAPALIARVERAVGPAWVRRGALGRRGRTEWRTGAWRSLRPRWCFRTLPEAATRFALVGGLAAPADVEEPRRHTILFGASGSGKSSYLVHRARERIRAGGALVAFDVHGDLGPRIVAGLSLEERRRVVAVDPTRPGPVPGVDPLRIAGETDDTVRAHLLSAFRRMGAEEGTPYWGFRLDRIFDTFLRLVQEEGGDLRDLYELLTEPARRELSRERTRIPEVRRFLEELSPIVRRNPEFLWPAAARLSRLLLAPALAALVVPAGPSLPLEALLERGQAIVWRVPLGAFGPEGTSLATTLLATRVYLGQVARTGRTGGGRGDVALLFDEAHLLAPRLVTEILTEGRKFGIGLYLASQYPERLEEGARRAASGAAGTHLAFRVPRAEAGRLASWVGLGPEEAERTLPTLPAGVAVRQRSGPGGRRDRIEIPPLPVV